MKDNDFEIRAVLFERVARSLAHSVGNATNVVSGRLSLVEMGSGLDADARESLERSRTRLLELQTELHRALEFGALWKSPPARRCVIEQVIEASQGRGFSVQLGPPCEAGKGPKAPIELALKRLLEALAGADMDAVWSVRPSEDDPADVTLALPLPRTLAPSDRRALLEPWFSRDSIEPELRYRRLLLAEALGLLEMSFARLAVSANENDETRTVLEATWSHA